MTGPVERRARLERYCHVLRSECLHLGIDADVVDGLRAGQLSDLVIALRQAKALQLAHLMGAPGPAKGA